jgi:hypothetical protein
VTSNAKGDKFYFYDFLLDIKRFDRFFEEIANPQNKVNVLTREDVRREF